MDRPNKIAATMNENCLVTDRWSNPEAERLYRAGWPDEPALKTQYEEGLQCGGCSFFAPFNADYGLCCNPASRHRTETVFEHFTCASFVNEGWGPHSFSERSIDEILDSMDERYDAGHTDAAEGRNEQQP